MILLSLRGLRALCDELFLARSPDVQLGVIRKYRNGEPFVPAPLRCQMVPTPSSM